MKTLRNLPFALALALLPCVSSSAEPATTMTTAVTTAATTVPAPLDWRHTIKPGRFLSSGAGVWVSPEIEPPFPFDTLIYHWKLLPERGEGFRLYVQTRFTGTGAETPWLYAGYWGEVKPHEGVREEAAKFDGGKLDQDTVILDREARSFRFKVVSEGSRRLAHPPLIGAIATLTTPTAEIAARHAREPRSTDRGTTLVLDVPLCAQQDTGGNRLPDRCQSAALTSAMEYFGKRIPLEQTICFTTDPEYKVFGIWPRTIAAAHEHGFDAYLDRFRDWDAVREAVAQNKVILCSIRMPKGLDYIAPPYPSIGGHIVALCGVTPDGRVIVTDSALTAKGNGHLLQWLQPDFEKIWMGTKGGVGMVICPPERSQMKTVKDLPPFPRPIPSMPAKDEPTTGAATP